MTPVHGAAPLRGRSVLPALVGLHIALIIASNYLVQLPFELWGVHTTWGSFTFPLVFVATDLTVRLLGKEVARGVITRVMLPALVASYAVSVLFSKVRSTAGRRWARSTALFSALRWPASWPTWRGSCSTSRSLTACAG